MVTVGSLPDILSSDVLLLFPDWLNDRIAPLFSETLFLLYATLLAITIMCTFFQKHWAYSNLFELRGNTI